MWGFIILLTGPDPDIAETCWRCPGAPVLAVMPMPELTKSEYRSWEDRFPEQ